MNAERLLAHYEKIADGPDAIVRLRRFVLDLAVRGKLVPQDPSDEPALELLKRIAEEKARLLKAGDMRKPRDLDTGNSVLGPYTIPASWRWVRLDGVGAIVGGGTPSASDAENFADPGEGVPWLTPADLGGYMELFISRGSRDLSEKGARTSSATLMPKGTVLFTSRAPIGYVAIAANPISTNQGFKSIVPYIPDCSRFIATVMQAFAPEIDAKAPGTTFKEVSGKIVAAVPFPLPPLAEQHRIVAKVDELMDLCDRLEAARAGREAMRDRLTVASLARLNAPDPETFQADARFALDTLWALTARPDQIKAMRQTILNLAVRGNLSEESTAKAATIGEYRTLQNGYAFKSTWFSKEGVRLLRNANIGHGEIRWNDVVRLPKDRVAEFERFRLNEGDIVLTLDRPFIMTGTKVARVGSDDLPSLLLQRVGRFVETTPGLDDDYLFLWINSPRFNEQIDPGRSNGVPHISSKQVEAAEILVPPLAEQHRIVAKVDALMALCDRLEASLTATAATRRRLLDALLAEALAPTNASLPGLSDQNTVALPKGREDEIIFAERSAYILTLAYERHRIARRERTFGHVKAQKILHLVEAEAGFDLGRAPVRDAAGPNDFKHMLAVEQWAREHKRFEFENNGGGYVLRQLPDFRKSLMTEHGPTPTSQAIIDKLICLFVSMNKRQAEIFATVYAAWNNLLIQGKIPTDAEIVRAARDDWHADKLNLPVSEFFAALAKLRLERIVPKGTGKFVHRRLQQDLFN